MAPFIAEPSAELAKPGAALTNEQARPPVGVFTGCLGNLSSTQLEARNQAEQQAIKVRFVDGMYGHLIGEKWRESEPVQLHQNGGNVLNKSVASGLVGIDSAERWERDG
jgi:hypothetical protein